MSRHTRTTSLSLSLRSWLARVSLMAFSDTHSCPKNSFLSLYLPMQPCDPPMNLLVCLCLHTVPPRQVIIRHDKSATHLHPIAPATFSSSSSYSSSSSSSSGSAPYSVLHTLSQHRPSSSSSSSSFAAASLPPDAAAAAAATASGMTTTTTTHTQLLLPDVSGNLIGPYDEGSFIRLRCESYGGQCSLSLFPRLCSLASSSHDMPALIRKHPLLPLSCPLHPVHPVSLSLSLSP